MIVIIFSLVCERPGGCPSRDVVCGHPAGIIETVWVVWHEEVPGGDEYPTPVSKL